jgi:transmembrane sensor
MTEGHDTVGEAAVAWVVRLASDQRTRADEEAFRAWMEADPTHPQAFADCSALWDGVEILAGSEDGRRALRQLRAPARGLSHVTRRTAVFGASGVAAAAAGLAAFVLLGGEQTLRTAPGEQKRFRLADGTGVLLNTDSRLRVSLSRSERRLFLDRGQAFFQVAKDRSRPFRVFAGRNEVRALGTAFEVRHMGDDVLVTLEEGRVAIYRDGRSAGGSPGWGRARVAHDHTAATPAQLQPAVVLAPGEQALLTEVLPVSVRQVDLRTIQAWRYGRMILDDAALGATVADLNRYGGVQIILADPKLAAIRVSGVFQTGRPDDFVEAVTSAFPVDIASQDENTIVLKAR